jgi:hypothetical protein
MTSADCYYFQFSASPGRFLLADIQSGPDGQVVEIKAEFPWGSETVETVRFLGAKVFENVEGTERELFEVYCSFMYSIFIGKHLLHVNTL